MKAMIASMAVLTIAMASNHAVPETGPLEIGDAIPMADTAMKGVDGKTVSLGDVKGEKGTLVIFACNHCPFVQAWQSRITEIGNAAQKKNVGVIVVNANDPVRYPTDDLEHMQAQAKKAGFEFPYVVDEGSVLARAFGATRTPEAFLFDAKGTLAYHGAVDDNAYQPDKVQTHYLQDALDAVLAGKAIPRATTKAVGCSIKFQ